jgi:hypothetical protein
LAPYSFAVAKHALDCMQEWHTPVRALAFELGRVPIYLAQETDMSVEAHLRNWNDGIGPWKRKLLKPVLIRRSTIYKSSS